MVVPRRYTCGILALPSYPYTVHIASSFSPTTTPSSISATLILPCGRLAQSRRIQRLLALVNEIKTNPRQEPRLLCRALGWSQSSIYPERDCNALADATRELCSAMA